MRVLCCNPDGGAFKYITEGWARALRACGHEFRNWDGKDASLREYQPNIYIGCSGWRQEYPVWARNQFGTRIAIHVNPHGSRQIGSHQGPVIDEQRGAIDWVKKQSPEVVFGYGDQIQMDQYWDKWKSYGFRVCPMMNAGDSLYFYPDPTNDPRFKGNVGFIGGHWPYKSINIDKFLRPVARALDCRIYGWSKYPGDYKARGPIQSPNDRKLFSSVKVAPCISEPHTTATGIDIPERIFKVSLCGAVAISDPVKDMQRHFSADALVMPKDPAHYLEACKYYLQDEPRRRAKARKQMEEVLSKHTYLHRISGLFEALGYKENASEALVKAEEIKKRRLGI